MSETRSDVLCVIECGSGGWKVTYRVQFDEHMTFTDFFAYFYVISALSTPNKKKTDHAKKNGQTLNDNNSFTLTSKYF